jgi:hypothetical protein
MITDHVLDVRFLLRTEHALLPSTAASAPGSQRRHATGFIAANRLAHGRVAQSHIGSNLRAGAPTFVRPYDLSAPLMLLGWGQPSCIVFVHAKSDSHLPQKFNLFKGRIYNS